jgi:RHS repeat-associated protein
MIIRDELTGMTYQGARHYNPEVGSFDRSDSLFLREPERCFERPEECQLYSYVANNPARWVDRDGLRVFTAGSFVFRTRPLYLDEYKIVSTARNAAVTNLASIFNKLVQGEKNPPLLDPNVKLQMQKYFGYPECISKADITAIKNGVESIKQHLYNLASKNNFEYASGAMYAAVIDSNSTKMYMAYLFFQAVNSGIDSKPGILTHEASHYNSSIGTKDDTSYGETAALQRALINPNGARITADNWEYFYEKLAQ